MPRRLLLAGGLAAAFDAGAQPPPELRDVVVTATRRADDALTVPAAIDRIDAAELARTRPRLQLSESLQRVPGVVARDRQNQAQDLQVSIRGFGARATFGVRGVRLYTDGIPATMPDGQGQVSHFALEAADRIEVLRGPFSALYGNASGGVIDVYSASPPANHEASMGALSGSHGLWRGSLSLRGPLAGAAGYRVDAGRVHGDGWRAHSAYTRDASQALLRDDRGATRWTLLANTLDLRAQDPQGLTAAERALDPRAASPNALRFDARKSVSQRQAGARWQHDLGETQGIDFLLYAGRRKTEQMLTVPPAAQASPTSGGGAIDLDRDYGGADLRWRAERGALALVAGASAEAADERRRGFENFVGERVGVVGALRRDEDNRVDSRDAFAQAGWHLAPRWHAQAGVRRSRVAFRSDDRYIRPGNPDDSGRLDHRATTPVLGVLFRATPRTSVYANAGRGFETPTFAELAYRRDGRSGLNDALAPARSRNAELGLRHRGPRHALSAAMFRSRTRDELVVASNAGGRSTFANAGRSERRGFEFAANGELAPQWHYAASLTWLDARYRGDFALDDGEPLIVDGRRIPGLARTSAWAELRWSPGTSVDVVIEARHEGRVAVDDANRAFAPAWARLDLGAERRFDWGPLQARVFARLENVLDRRYVGSVIVNEANGRYFEPAPGRGWIAGVSLEHRFE